MVMGDTMVGADTMVHDIRNTIISSSQHSIESPTLLNPPLKCKNMGVLLRMSVKYNVAGKGSYMFETM